MQDSKDSSDPTADRPHKGAGRLGRRLALLVAAAMLPLGALSFVQTQAMQTEVDARSELALRGQTLQAAEPLIQMIRRAEATAETLALTMNGLAKDTLACRDRMADIQAAHPEYSLVAYIPVTGLMTCSSNGTAYDFTNHLLFDRLIGPDGPSFLVNRAGPISGTSILGMVHPVRDAAGTKVGVVSISIPHHDLAALQPAPTVSRDDPIILATFDSSGTLLASTSDFNEVPRRLPSDRSPEEMIAAAPITFTAVSNSNYRRNYSVIPLADGLFLMGSWRTDQQAYVNDIALSAYLMPVLMWLSGMLVALLAADRLVVRHISRLGRAMTDFAGGNRIPQDLSLQQAPQEISQLGRAYQDMIDIILRDEAELENLLRQKQMLLREVHHRTGNSLQLIASIIRMHMRQSPSEEVQEMLASLHDRVMSLATVHLGLYQTADQAEVQMDQLLTRVATQMMTVATQAGRQLQIKTDIDPIRLGPDQAVPLSLLLAELLSGLSEQRRGQDDGQAQATVELRRCIDNRAVLRMITPAHDPGQGLARGGQAGARIGAQLIHGFTQQLQGQVSHETQDGEDIFQMAFHIRQTDTATL
ncbi:sensor histidine kinase [Neogemmobacter tilapiae]|uniref:histidine kinase n=1 Tax=Neogemmobacter tilapiae TaxID=875041 RepID=A0A918TMU0_9RHOB|nr:sensor histidine kinase [Gemmobacter tilapiae]GHC54688.1 histidine kinase [Gemmobacter tilapiae]